MRESAEPREWDDRFWRKLTGQDQNDGATRQLVRTLNLFVVNRDESGSLIADRISPGRQARIRRRYPRLVRQITGRPFTGATSTIESAENRRPGWLYIMFVTALETPDACAATLPGRDPGLIVISLACDWSDDGRFDHVVAHEIGHAYGLYHVDEPGNVMHPTFHSIREFSPKEQRYTHRLYGGKNHRETDD